MYKGRYLGFRQPDTFRRWTFTVDNPDIESLSDSFSGFIFTW
jgi:hypothetical protein